ncbi:LppA family lipoprotein [Nocardia sp. NPDC051570]|uniref:LppA family lipoprotein n=1 Tax=Nocardia sp. NPDC051570 TaxID=3364324 RepID=UPI0037933587
MFDNPYEKTGSAETAKAAEQLTKLPSLEETEARLQSAVEQLGTYISSLVPGLTWTWMDERSVQNCSPPYDQTHGQMVNLPNYVASSGIPDDVWPQVAERTRQLAADLGATGSESFLDKPGSHAVRFYSKEGTSLQPGTKWIDSQGAAAIGGNTGCRLPAARKSASSPTTPHP